MTDIESRRKMRAAWYANQVLDTYAEVLPMQIPAIAKAAIMASRQAAIRARLDHLPADAFFADKPEIDQGRRNAAPAHSSKAVTIQLQEQEGR